MALSSIGSLYPAADGVRWPYMSYTPAVEPSPYVYAVHSTRADETGAVEVLFCSETEARAYAVSRSNDFRVLASVVTRYALGRLGTRPDTPSPGTSTANLRTPGRYPQARSTPSNSTQRCLTALAANGSTRSSSSRHLSSARRRRLTPSW
jgi:hypothetical protein